MRQTASAAKAAKQVQGQVGQRKKEENKPNAAYTGWPKRVKNNFLSSFLCARLPTQQPKLANKIRAKLDNARRRTRTSGAKQNKKELFSCARLPPPPKLPNTFDRSNDGEREGGGKR